MTLSLRSFLSKDMSQICLSALYPARTTNTEPLRGATLRFYFWHLSLLNYMTKGASKELDFSTQRHLSMLLINIKQASDYTQLFNLIHCFIR
jgi:hypothetical protein